MLLDPLDYLAAYNRGDITQTELRIRLVQAAARTQPEEIAARLPTEWIEALREESCNPPANPEEMRFFHTSTCVRATPADRAGYWQEESRLYYDGAWRWHRFFHEV